MKNIFLIALREYAENAKTKGFWIGIFLFPVMLFIGIRVPEILAKKAVPTRHFVLVDRSGQFEKLIDERVASANAGERRLPLAGPPPSEENRKRYDHVPVPGDIDAGTTDSLLAGVRPYLVGDKKIEVEGKPAELFAAVIVPEDVAKTHSDVEYWCTNLADTSLRDLVSGVLNEEIRRREFVARGADPKVVAEVQAIAVDVTSKDPKKAAGSETVSELDTIRQWAPSGFVYLLWVAIFTVAQMLLNNTIEEKSSRIIEVLLSSVTPTELMAGKLAGIAAVGLTLVVAWMASLFPVLQLLGGQTGKITASLLQIVYTPQMILPFVGYFFLGYLLYAGIFLAIGSVCSTIKEAQNLMGPLMLVMFVPLLTMMFIPRDPHGPLAVALSWIPLYTPFAMMNRMGASPPASQIVGTVALLLVSIPVAIWLSGRIFRIGILRTGQPPKLLEMLRWVGRSN
ncbi:MAG TPA: ABC transporter permease [Planctomycetota bacterium]|nr:ABC transporter permease [Planctomycetota bacterium]